MVFDTGKSISERQSTVASSIPDAHKTEPMSQADTVDADELSESGYTQTSCASSTNASERPRFPALPPGSVDGTFQCPFCFMMIRVTNSNAWRKHIFADLRPYSCVALDCPIAGTEFGQRHQWMQHMLQNHWQEWHCEFCDHEPFTSKWSLRDHLKNQHARIIPTNEIETPISRCEKPQTSDNVKKCPLCLLSLRSIKEYRHHVGRHLENIALFVLPQVEEDSEESDDENRMSDRSDLESDFVDSDHEDQSELEDLPASGDTRTQHEDTSSGKNIQTNQVSEEHVDVPQAELARPEDAQDLASSSMGGFKSNDRDNITFWAKQEQNNEETHPGEIYHQGRAEMEVGAQIYQAAAHAPSEETALSDTPKVPGSIWGVERSVEDIEPSSLEGSENERRPKDDARIEMNAQNDAGSDQEAQEEQRKDPEVPSATEIATTRKSDTAMNVQDDGVVTAISESRTVRSRDSGLAQDYDTQRFNVYGLQDALDSYREEKGRDRSKENDLDAQRTNNKEPEIRNLNEENTTLRRERDSGLGRTNSKIHETQEQKARLLERINTVNPNHRRRRSLSRSQPEVTSTGDALVDDRTIRGPPDTTRGFGRFENNTYSILPTIRDEAENVLSLSSATPSTKILSDLSSDYIPMPLPPKPKPKDEEQNRKHRDH